MSSTLEQKSVQSAVSYALKQLFPYKYKTPEEKNKLSSLGIKYPTLRDHPLHSALTWLNGKRADDGAEGFWRIHDSLYDFTDFISIHPGGKDWLKLTKGTDITEAFEAHHLSSLPEGMLPKYFVTKAKQPRNSPFTFHEDGFYRTLRRNIYEKLPTLPKGPAQRSKYIADSLLLSYITLAILAVHFRSYIVGALAGFALTMTAVAAHNFFHRKDNFRMYYFDFTMMLSREWRISHALSHHLYTNTINDLEISGPEPFFQYLPTEKNIIVRYLSWLYFPIVCAFFYLNNFVKTLIELAFTEQEFIWPILLPFTVPILTFLVTKESALFCITMFLWTTAISSAHLAAVGLNAGHHHPDVFHDGDTPRSKGEIDWGLHQLDTVMDRNDITGSHFRVLTNFGDHALHHLFPTLDHGLLEYLYPVLFETCKQFGTEWRLSTPVDLISGQFKQLARVEPNKNPPGKVKNAE